MQRCRCPRGLVNAITYCACVLGHDPYEVGKDFVERFHRECKKKSLSAAKKQAVREVAGWLIVVVKELGLVGFFMKVLYHLYNALSD